MKTKMDGLLNTELLQQYAIVDKDAELKKASQNGGAKTAAAGVLSVKSTSLRGTKPRRESPVEKSETKTKTGLQIK